MRDWGTLGSLSLNDDLQPDAYVDASNRANLLLYTARSYWGLYNGPLTTTNRYTHNPTISKTKQANPQVFGEIVALHSNKSQPTILLSPKWYSVNTLFLLRGRRSECQHRLLQHCTGSLHHRRSLADTCWSLYHEKEYDKAIADMQIWENSYTTSKVALTEQGINDFYGKLDYYTPQKPTVKKNCILILQ